MSQHAGVPEQGLLEWEDVNGSTALTIAAAEGHSDIVRLLLDLGADYDHMNRLAYGGTALHAAMGRSEICMTTVEGLLNKGANPFVENCGRVTAYDIAMTRTMPTLCRRFEKTRAEFCGYVYLAILKRGESYHLDNEERQKYHRRWVSIVSRYTYCPASEKRHKIISSTMYIFPSHGASVPTLQVDLPGRKGPAVYREDTTRVFLGGVEPNDPNLGKHVTLAFSFGATKDRSSAKQFVDAIRKGRRVSFVDEKTESVYRKMRQFARTWTRDDLMLRQASCPPDYLSHADSSRRHRHRKSNDASEDVTFDRSVSEPKESKKGNECIICLSKPCTAGIVHGESVHMCLCQECSQRFKGSGNRTCPICRQVIERVVTNIY